MERELIHYLKSLNDQFQDFRSIRHFLDRNCNVYGKDVDGWTALHFYAAHNGPVEDIESLLSKGALINQVTHDDGWTPLHLAVNNDNFNIVEVLITNGADVNAKDLDDWTPLQIAAQNGYVDITDILSECHDDEKDSNGQTAPHLAACDGHANVIQVLIKSRASVNLIDHLQQTALLLAVQEGHLEAMNLLIDCGGNLVDVLKVHDQK
jgi:ankyrin repeat protein